MRNDGATLEHRMALLRSWHGYVLAKKGLDTDDALHQARRVDATNSLVAARTLFSSSTNDLIGRLFSDEPAMRALFSKVTDEVRAGHLGFRIYEPLDIYVEMLEPWAGTYGLEIVGIKRFTPSLQFRDRVGGHVEMAQVWIEREGEQVEIELFDIHKPICTPQELFDRDTVAEELLMGGGPIPGASDWSLFESDDIWHYGIHVGSAADVAQIHHAAVDLARRSSSFEVKSAEVVANPWHGSLHTKIANIELGLEIEFLTYNVDWDRLDG